MLKDKGTNIPFLVCGHGGYYHLHGLNIDAHPKPGKPIVDPDNHAHLVFAEAHNHGYVTLTVDKNEISGAMHTVDELKYAGKQNADTFRYTAKPLTLPDGEVVSL